MFLLLLTLMTGIHAITPDTQHDEFQALNDEVLGSIFGSDQTRFLTREFLPEHPPRIPQNFDESRYVELCAPVVPFDVDSLDVDVPFDVKAFLEEYLRIPDQNAAPRYLYAFAHISGGMHGLYDADLYDEFDARQNTFSDRFFELANRFDISPESVSDTELEQMSQFMQPYFELIDWAQEREDCYFLAPNGLFHSTSIEQPAARNFSRMTRVEIGAAARRGDIQGVITAVRRHQRLVDDITRMKGTISQLVRTAMMSMIMETIRDVVLPAETLTADDLQQLVLCLRELDAEPLPRLIDILKFETVYFLKLAMMQQEMIPDVKSLSFLKLPVIAEADKKFYMSSIHRLFAATDGFSPGQYPELELVCREIEDEAVHLTELAEKQDESVLASALTSVGIKGTPMYVGVHTAELFPRKAYVTFRSINQIRATLLLTAIEIDHRKTGEYIQDESELLQVALDCGLDGIPLDAVTKLQPLKFCLHENRPAVYSVGQDQIDDQGHVHEAYGYADGRRGGDQPFFIGGVPDRSYWLGPDQDTDEE